MTLGVSDPKACVLGAIVCRELEHKLPLQDSHLGVSGSGGYPFHHPAWPRCLVNNMSVYAL